MTTPTQESLDRARTWIVAEQSEAGIQNPNPSAKIVNSLALEFDRVRLEGKIEAFQLLADSHCHRCANRVPVKYVNEKGLWCHEDGFWCYAVTQNNQIAKCRAQLAAHPRQGAAHDAEGGESDEMP